jgi:hypothetical protein
MRLGAAFFGVLFTLAGATSASAAVRISQDHGGRIVSYLYKFAVIRDSGERVIIDGTCSSACTMVLGAVPRDRICVTPRASLGFHAAWEFGPSGRPVTSSSGTRFLLASYPADIRSWISRRGGLSRTMIYLRGRELAALYPTCNPGEGAQTRSADANPRVPDTRARINASARQHRGALAYR